MKFVPPVIKKDSEVKPEEELKSQEELNKTNTAIGAFDVKGNDEAAGEVLKPRKLSHSPSLRRKKKPRCSTLLNRCLRSLVATPNS